MKCLNRYQALWIHVMLLLGLSMRTGAHNGAVAIAVPVEGITIDGELSDWPEEHDAPDTVVTDRGARSQANFRDTPETIDHVFLGRSEDVDEEHRDFCRRARSATEGFIAVAKHRRGLGRSLYRGLQGDRIWTRLGQAAYNLKKFLQRYRDELIAESSLVKLGLLG